MFISPRSKTSLPLHVRYNPFVLLAMFVLVMVPEGGMHRADGQGQPSTDDIWRLAGTFNNWNPADNHWNLTLLREPQPGGRHLRVIRIADGELAPGTYWFKFVHNGDWNQGHLGESSDQARAVIVPNAVAATQSIGPVRLEQPGSNIRLDVHKGVTESIILDPAQRACWQVIPDVHEPLVMARVADRMIRTGQSFTIDLSTSLIPHAMQVAEVECVSSPDQSALTAELPDANSQREDPLWWQHREVAAHKAGAWTLAVRLRTGAGWSEPTTLSIHVVPPIFAIHDSLPDGSIVLEPLTDGSSWAAIVDPPGTTSAQTYKIHDDSSGVTYALTVDQSVDGEADNPYAIVYDKTTRHGYAIEGRLGLRQRSGGLYTLVDDTILDHGAIAHDPQRPDQFDAISAGLGLADIYAETALDGSTEHQSMVLYLSAGAQPDGGKSDTNQSLFKIPMSMVPDNELRPIPLSTDQPRVRWTARVSLPGVPWLHYHFEWKRVNGSTVESSQYQALIDPAFTTPDWAKQAVWYQIFPERFRNGNPTNDPWGGEVFPVKWNAPWLTVLPGEFEAWQRRVRRAGDNPDKYDNARSGSNRFYNVVWDRRYGGDLQGVISELNYLKSLGVNSIYFTPVFEAPSQHKYDTADYRHIDDNFGNSRTRPPDTYRPDPDEDFYDHTTWKWSESDRTFLELLHDAHALGMHVIIDGVFNHTGRSHPAFEDLMKNGKASDFVNWYFGRFDRQGHLESWQAWDGPSGWLPKLRQDSDGSLSGPVRQHIFEVTRRWMDPNGDGDPDDGIDGWRLDVATDVGD